MDNRKEIIIPQGWEIDEVRGNKIILSKKELPKPWYIARDKNGDLYLYSRKPIKYIEEESWYTQPGESISIYLENNEFPSVKWEDDKPTEVELKLKTDCKP